jgi:transcriptional antiterminator
MFAEELYCSKSTIVNDLVFVQDWIEKHNLTLRRKQNQGLWIEGNESDYRRATKDLIFVINENEYEEYDFDEDIEKLDYRINYTNFMKIKNMFPDIDLYCIQNIIQNAEKVLKVYFTDQAFLNLIIHIAITIKRVKNKKNVSVNMSSFESLKEEDEYQVAAWVVNELSKNFKIKFPDEEISYISMHMLGAKIQENYDSEEHSKIVKSQDNDFVDIAKSIIKMTSEVLNVDLIGDNALLTRLVLHLRPTIIRLKYGLNLTNPMLQEIKRDYTSIFGATWACSGIFEKKLGVMINEDEVGYIALHIALAIENSNSKINTIVVCSSGIGTSQLVASKLTKKFGNLNITHILPFNLLNEKIIDQSDLIVTTLRKVQDNKKVVFVSTLLDENDLKNIENVIGNIRKSSINYVSKTEEEKQVEKNNIVFERELCFLDSEITDFTQAIIYYGKLMEEKGYAKVGFHEDILEREKKGTTYIGKGIAIPHARDIFVNKSKVCIVKFKNPIEWHKNKLDFMFILCLKFDDVNLTKKFFNKFYSILENEEIILKIKNAQSIDNIIDFFN